MGTHPIFESDFDCLTECRTRKTILRIQLIREKQRDRKANINGSNTEDQRNAAHGNTDRSALIGCRKCGYPGHMTYECRNGVKTGSSSYAMIHCDISSTSSDDEDVRMLRELKESIKE